MANMVETLMQDAAQAAPNSIVAQATNAAVTTVIDPSPMNVLADIELIVTLAAELRTKLAGVHPSVINVLKALF